MNFSKLLNSAYNFLAKKYSSKTNKTTNESGTKIFTTESLEYSDCEPFLPLVDGSVAYVCKVYDGDTVTLCWLDIATGKPVRLGCRINGIDTPELRGSGPVEKELALLAKERMTNAVLGEFVTIVNPSNEKYGRVLSDLKTDKIDSVSDYMLADPTICKPYDGGTKVKWE